MEEAFRALVVVSAFTVPSVVRSLWLADDVEAREPLPRPAVSPWTAPLDMSVWYCMPSSISEGVVILWRDELAAVSVVVEIG